MKRETREEIRRFIRQLEALKSPRARKAARALKEAIGMPAAGRHEARGRGARDANL